MKKIATIAIMLLVMLTFSACGDQAMTAVHYGIANDNPVFTTVTGKKSGSVSAITLEEALKPTAITDSKAEAAAYDVVAVEKDVYGTKQTVRYYKTVFVGGDEFTFSAEKGDYVTSDGVTFDEWIAKEGNSEKYFKALENGNVAVSIGGEKKKDIITKNTAYKSKNGYWTTDGASKWVKYRNATIDYLVKNGFSKADTLEKNENGIYVDSNGISTGASWTSMKEYVSAIKLAYAKITK